MTKFEKIFTLGLYWPMLVPITKDYTVSQVLFAFILSGYGSYIILTEIKIYSKGVFRLFFTFFFAAAAISLIGLAADGSVQRSLSDGVRWVFFAIYVLIGYGYAKKHPSESNIINHIKLFAVASVIFSALVYFESLYWFVDMFKGRLSSDDLPFHFYRFSGFSGFPTDLGSVLSLVFFLILIDRSNIYFSNLEKVVFLILIAVGILGSASRGGILHVAVGGALIGLYLILKSIASLKISKNSIALFFFMGSIALVSWIFVINSQLIETDIMKYIDVEDTKSDTSVSHRFLEIDGAIDVLFNKYFLFGIDRDYPLQLPVIEGFWTHWLLRYGWIGLFGGLAVFYFFTKKSFKSNCLICRALAFWFLSFFISTAFFSDVLFRFKGPFIYGIIFGYCLHASKERLVSGGLGDKKF